MASFTRRQIVTGCLGGLLTLSGCSSFVTQRESVQIYSLNETITEQEIYIEINDVNSDELVDGRTFSLGSGLVKKSTFEIAPGSYQLRTTVDDVSPRPEQQVEWNIGSEDCSDTRFVTFSSTNDSMSINILSQRCEPK